MKRTVGKKTAKAMLLAAALIWGCTFVIIKTSLDDVRPFFLTGLRFSIAALTLAAAFPNKLRRIDGKYLKNSAVIGANLFLGFGIQSVGLLGTTPSKSAFLSSCYCALVPLLAWVLLRRRPDRWQAGAALLCVAGVALISLNGDLSVSWGDLVSFAAAFFYAGQFISLEKRGKGLDVVLVTTLEFAFAGLYGWVASFLLEGTPHFSNIPASTWASVLYLGVMAGGVAFLFQNVGQVYTDPASASLLLSLECVFGVAVSVAFYGDKLTPRLLAGFALVFLAILCSETKFSFLRRKAVPPAADEDGQTPSDMLK